MSGGVYPCSDCRVYATSQSTFAEQTTLMKIPYGLTAAVMGTTAMMVMVQPQTAVRALSASQVATTARQVTVLIAGQNPGSGVIIKREGNTYTVLTARHVVATPDEYEIVTPDGQRTKLVYATVKPLSGVDLAILEFTSSRNYTVAKLGNSRSAPSGTTIFVAGFPVPTAAITESIFNFTEGKMTANAERPLADGYALVYSNNTLPGMSGGPVLNEAGEVIGIHGRGDTESSGTKTTANPDIVVKTGFNLAIPINTFLSLSGKTGVTGFPSPAPAPTSNQPTADDFYLQANAKYKKGDLKGAITDFDQAIRLNPNFALAYNNRGNARSSLGDKQSAIADYDQAIRLDANNALTYYNRGNTRRDLGDNQRAITDYNQAIRLSPNDTHTYNNRGNVRLGLGDNQGAIADYNQALRLDPNDAFAYMNRGIARFGLGDKQGAIADFDQAIRLDPNNALAYNNRGNARYNSSDKQGAIADFQKAIRLNPDYAAAYVGRGSTRYELGDNQGAIADFQKAAALAQSQGNKQVYELATSNLRRLQR
jgi:tetratricopeptide (TPR) repeat protein